MREIETFPERESGAPRVVSSGTGGDEWRVGLCQDPRMTENVGDPRASIRIYCTCRANSGKSESIRITNEKGYLSQEEVDRVVRKAEEFASEDATQTNTDRIARDDSIEMVNKSRSYTEEHGS